MEYTASAALYWHLFKGVLKNELEKLFDSAQADFLVEKTRLAYQRLITRSPEIGGDENSLSDNLYLVCVFVACYQEAGISAPEMEGVIVNGLKHSKITRRLCKNNDSDKERYREWVRKTSRWTLLNAGRYPANWVMREPQASAGCAKEEGARKDFTITRCAIQELCGREGCLELLPVFYQMELIVADLGRARLARKTAADSGAISCDYCFIER